MKYICAGRTTYAQGQFWLSQSSTIKACSDATYELWLQDPYLPTLGDTLTNSYWSRDAGSSVWSVGEHLLRTVD